MIRGSGVLDVDAELDTITPGQFDELLASEQLDPPADGWEPYAMLAALIWNTAALSLAAQSGDEQTAQKAYETLCQIKQPDDFMPGAETSKPLRGMSVDEELAMVRQRYGNKR